LPRAFTVGLCLPSTCTNAELNHFLNPNVTDGIVQGISCFSTDNRWKTKDILAMYEGFISFKNTIRQLYCI